MNETAHVTASCEVREYARTDLGDGDASLAEFGAQYFALGWVLVGSEMGAARELEAVSDSDRRAEEPPGVEPVVEEVEDEVLPEEAFEWPGPQAPLL